MSFPADANPVLGQIFVDGAWVDATSDIRGSQAISIQRGRRDIQGRMPPTMCDFTLNNGGEVAANRGRWTDDNPMSPYFEKLPIYTPFRVVVPGSADGYYYAPGYDTTDYAFTADKAQLDITGDIDIMAEISPASWTVPSNSTTGGIAGAVIASKTGVISSQYSWTFGITSNQRMFIIWSATGDSNAGFNVRSQPFVQTDRMAIRVRLDVNNGGGGWTVTFYTAPSIDGTWTSIGTVSQAGVTSVYSGTGNLEIGSGVGGTRIFSNYNTWSGKIYCFRLYNGFFGSGGTLVAEANFRGLGVGTTGWADGLGNTWSVQNQAYVTSDAVRFWGEIEAFPQEWDSTGKDMLARVHAADLFQRLQTSQQQLESPIYANRIALDPSGYWTFEDGSDATQAGAASTLTQPATVSNARFKADDTLPGSNGSLGFQNGGAFIRGKARITSITGVAGASFFFKFGTLPITTVQIASFTTAGSPALWWRIETDGSSFTVRAFDLDGGSLLSSSILTGSIDLGEWVAMRLELTDNGANTDWALAWFQVGSSNFLGGSGSIVLSSPGRFSGFTVNGSASNTDMYLAHMMLDTNTVDFVNFDFAQAANGYIGERFADRFRRLCLAAGITPDLDGWEDDTDLVGRQRVDTLLNNLQRGADVDGGILVGSRRQGNTITYITRRRLQLAPYAITLQHNTGSHLSQTPKPVKDTTGVANDITVSRPGGGFSRYVVTDGRYGTDSIGPVPGGGEYDVVTDEDTSDIASWLGYVGTWPDARFPEIAVQLNRPETLFASTLGQQILVTDVGRWIEITNMPAGQKPGPVEQIAQGYREVLDNDIWSIVFNGTPYGPYRAGVIEDFIFPPRFAPVVTTVSAATATATSLTFNTVATSARWATAAEMPGGVFVAFDLMIAGERMTLTNITGTGTAQTATVTRSVNGVQKAISGNPLVKFYRTATFGR